MELTLKRLLEHAEFKKYRGKGYDPTEVDDFLDRAAAMAGKVEVQLTQALDQAKAGGGGAPGAPDPAVVEAEVERRVAERLASAPSGPSEEDTAAQAQRTLVMAQRTADAAVREAREDADKMLAAAKEQSTSMVADAESRAATLNADTDKRSADSKAEIEAEAVRERREARQRLAGEITELEGIRESLRSDVNVLERHVEEQRSQLGSTLAELQQILDDPSGFRMAPAPALADPQLPDFSDLDAPAEAPAAAPEPEAPVDAAAEPTDELATDPDPEPDVVEATPEPTPAAEAPAPPPPPPALAFDEIDHEAPGLDDPTESGPPTAPVSAVELGLSDEAVVDADDDAFLTELRKAMADDEPLGPRDDAQHEPSDALFDDDDRRGWRFGRKH
ncbi:DivIVA domain-containing protein [Aquihabitans sp. McL0605]|uniref:DivIVA domain-containing protein n=1 Tax=Aquihabitans sp. McL0605 TaxID=3415671 RepID=UPI003CE9354F